MRRSVASASVAALLATVLLAAPAAGRLSAPPQGFFGIAPQTRLTDLDAQYMAAGGIGSVRVPFAWSLIQPIRGGAYDWSSVDPVVEVTARAGLTVLPFLAGTPSWLARKSTTLPIYSAEARNAWSAFVRAAVERYGPGGSFWGEHTPETATTGGLSPIPTPLPVRSWQVWNEANFFYFAYPVSPSLYARLLKLTQPAIKAVDPDAEVILSGLFGDPDEGGQRGMDAADFLDALYRMPGIKSRFDAVALHPYAFHVDDLEALVEEVRQVVLDHHDPGAGLYITEMGWGSQNDPRVVAFEQGIRGQARELRGAYRYLLDERRRLNLEAAYWFSWKDVPRVCNFCDSVGLFRSGLRFKPKPAWNALVALTGGRARP